MDVHDAVRLFNSTLDGATTQFRRLPGSQILVRYIQNSYQNDPIRSVVELMLFLFALRYLTARRYSTTRKELELTSDEIDELVDEWAPEPLVAPLSEVEHIEQEKRPIISGPSGPKSKLTTGRTVTNLASYNFYNTISSPILQERAVQVLRSYGVGACGPPNFYGTQDVHMNTEREIARFLRVPAAIVYAQSFSTISSVIPAFSKRGDIIVADRGVNFAILKGLQISRSTIHWFNHNDMYDLEQVLARVAREQHRKKLTRRFIVTEGLFENTGDMADLPTLVELKNRYKYRLILDETHSFGVLGDTGRGLTEHQHVDPVHVEMIIGSLAHALCAGGGFCAGSDQVVDHQRISSSAYVFSAAIPAMLAVTASETIKILEASPDLVPLLRDNTRVLRAQLARSEHIVLSSAPENPRVLFHLKRELDDAEDRVLVDIVDEALANNVLIVRVKHVLASDDGAKPRPFTPRPRAMLACCVSTGHTKKEVEQAGSVVRKAVGKVLGKLKGAKA